MTTLKNLPALAGMCVLTAALSGAVFAETPPAAPAEKQAPASKSMMYGHQLMTDAERTEYRAKMRALKTPQEREAFRAEHHKLMQERAKERGVTLPDMPAHQGMGKGMHQGMGDGMHKGMGMGQGSKPDTQSPAATPPASPPPK